MSKWISGIIGVALCFAALAGCGSNSMSSPLTPPGTGTVPASFSVKDNPPTGVTVLTFELQVTGASLLPADSNSQAVSMISKPQEVELEHLQTESALLANINVPAGTYNGLTVTFANPQMTILNQTGGTLTLGGQSCANQQVCKFSPALNQASVTVQQPTAPFPITLSANSPLALRMDFDVNASIQSGDLSITPTVTLTQLPAPNLMSGEHEGMELFGNITGVDQASQSFTLQGIFSGNTFTVGTNGNTEFDFENSCSANDFSCLQTGQVVKVEVQQQSDGSLVAREIKLFTVPNQFALRGTVTAINSTADTFQVVVFDGDGFGEQMMSNVSIGFPLTISPAAQATFSIDTNNVTLPAGLNFASLNDMMIGQAVQIHPTGVSGSLPNLTITADTVQLEPSEVTGLITAINTSSNPQMFTLGTLPPLFANAGISTIQADVLSSTLFEADDNMNVTGLGSLSVNNKVSVRGLLFNTTGTPTMVAEKVDLRQ